MARPGHPIGHWESDRQPQSQDRYSASGRRAHQNATYALTPMAASFCHGSGHGWAKKEAPAETEGPSGLRFYCVAGQIESATSGL
jgi:hypothetical protein